MQGRMTGFVFQDSYRSKIKTLTREQVGTLVLALSEYHETGNITELDGPEAVAFWFIKEDIDRIDVSYALKCEVNKTNREKRTRKARRNAVNRIDTGRDPVNDHAPDADTADPYETLPTSASSYETLPNSTNVNETAQDKDKEKDKVKDKVKEKNKDEPEETVSRDTGKKTGEAFARFWYSYPRKQNKAKALKAFRALDPDERLLSTILDAVERQKQSPQWTKDGGQFIPLATTWLSGRRWEDEDITSSAVTDRESGAFPRQDYTFLEQYINAV